MAPARWAKQPSLFRCWETIKRSTPPTYLNWDSINDREKILTAEIPPNQPRKDHKPKFHGFIKCISAKKIMATPKTAQEFYRSQFFAKKPNWFNPRTATSRKSTWPAVAV